MLHAEARRPARRDAAGDYVPLGWQDPALWDAAMIAEAEALLRRAAGLGRASAASSSRPRCSRRTCTAAAAARPTGRGSSQLYDALLALSASPVVAINRALARGAAATAPPPASPRSTRWPAIPRLAEYQPCWAARAELLARAGAVAGARHAYALAIGLERDPAVRRFLQQAQAALPEA